MRILFLSLFIMLTNFSFGVHDEDPFALKVKSKLEKWVERYPQEKVYLHTDRDHYEVGDTIWFRAYLTNCYTHQLSNLSRFVYVELRDKQDKICAKIKIPYRDSVFAGHVVLDKQLKHGDYVLRAYSYWMQNAGDEHIFRKQIKLLNPKSAIVQHTITWDKDGDDYFVNIRFHNSRNEAYEKVLVEYVRGEKVRAKYTTDQGVIRFKLDSEYFGQKMLVRFKEEDPFEHEQVLYLPDPRKLFDVTYLPEGGDLLQGCRQTVAIKVIGNDGLSREVSGEIMDDLGNRVAHVRTLHKGMGAFELQVDPERRYHGIFSMEGGEKKRFDLPEAVSSGVALKLVTNSDMIGYFILATEQFPKNKNLYLLVHARGVPCYCEPVSFNSKGKFLKADFPEGVLSFVLLDDAGRVCSERLCFVHGKNRGGLQLTSNKAKHGVRGQVNMEVQVNNEWLESKAGSFSVAVTDDKQVFQDSLQDNIMSYLLLNSDIRGYIEEPAFYFRESRVVTSRLLDLLLMTQGWKRFNVSDIIQSKYDSLAYFVERGQVISGNVINYWGKEAKNANVLLFSNTGIIEMVEADKAGKFVFDGIVFPDSTKFFLQGRSKRGGKIVSVIVDRDSFLEPTVKIPFNPNITTLEDEFYKRIFKDYYYENGEKVYVLNEVTINSKKNKKSNSHYGVISSYSLDSAQLSQMKNRDIRMVLSELPGVTVIGNSITRFGRNIMLLIDEFPEGFSRLEMIRIEEIMEINLVLPPISTALWGKAGERGVISVTTNPDFVAPRKYPPHRTSFSMLGYQKYAEFYMPRYDVDSVRQALLKKKDERRTIYWNPKISTNQDGKASFSFFTSDSYGPYTLIIEGVMNDGTIYRKEEKIELGL